MPLFWLSLACLAGIVLASLLFLPVWLWTAVSPQTWGPARASATAGGVTVTATASASTIEWRMGDGHAVTCTSPGTAYSPTAGGGSSPDCGYTYAAPSSGQPGGVYTVTAVTTWQVRWAGGGQNGALTVTRQSSTQLQVRELAVVNG